MTSFSPLKRAAVTPAAKEVRHYVSALRKGYEAVRASGLIRLETVLAVQAELERIAPDCAKLPGTVLKNESTGQVIYEPPQSAAEVERLMEKLIDFIHADDGLDPLLRMAVAHHQFESIHPVLRRERSHRPHPEPVDAATRRSAGDAGALSESLHHDHQAGLLPPAANRAR